MLDKAIAIAAKAHQGQTDRVGAPYILHPIRVMMRMETEIEMTAAVLHDVVEDTDWTLDELRQAGFPDAVVDAVDGLTRRDGEPYTAYVKRASADPIARKIKLADLEDNMDLRRAVALTEDDLQRMKRYHRHWVMLRQEDQGSGCHDGSWT